MQKMFANEADEQAAQEIPTTAGINGLTVRQWAGLILAPLAFMWFQWGWAPLGTTPSMRSVAALTTVMAILWVCESVPLAATALLPLVFLPVSGAAKPAEAAAAYSGDLIFLFIGGFVLANGIERWGLHRRIAAVVLAYSGTRQRNLVGSLMAVTAFISLWISNTAAALLMMPVGLSLLSDTSSKGKPGKASDWRFGAAMVLGISTSATIGGMGTPIGSTPNLLFINTLQRLYNINIGFKEWMTIGIPLVVVFTLSTWWLFVGILFPLGTKRVNRNYLSETSNRRELGPMKAGEIFVAAVFVFTTLCWIFREPRSIGGLTIGLGLIWPEMSDGTIAIAAALALFCIPISLRPARFALDWTTGGKIPWDIILLFGGGLCLADAIARSGLDANLVHNLTRLQHIPVWLLVLVVCLTCIVLSEVASNTAAAALLLPLLGSLAMGLSINPVVLMLPAAFATSLGFMLPIATPPNTLALASQKVTVSQMAVAGFILNTVGLILILLLLYLVGFSAFGVSLASGHIS